MKKIVISLLVVGLFGCSTEPVSPKDAKPVQPAIKYQKKEGLLPITIIRDKGVIGVACEITVYINGEQIANLNRAEKVTPYVSPGQIILGAGFNGAGLCSGPVRKERAFTINNNGHMVFRIFMDQDANIDILPSTIK